MTGEGRAPPGVTQYMFGDCSRVSSRPSVTLRAAGLQSTGSCQRDLARRNRSALHAACRKLRVRAYMCTCTVLFLCVGCPSCHSSLPFSWCAYHRWAASRSLPELSLARSFGAVRSFCGHPRHNRCLPRFASFFLFFSHPPGSPF
jgi:hypothetical protein